MKCLTDSLPLNYPLEDLKLGIGNLLSYVKAFHIPENGTHSQSHSSRHAFLKKIASSEKFCCYYGLLLLTIFFRGRVHLHSPPPPPPGGDSLLRRRSRGPEEGTSLIGTKLNAISWQQNRADLFIKGQYIGLQN